MGIVDHWRAGGRPRGPRSRSSIIDNVLSSCAAIAIEPSASGVSIFCAAPADEARPMGKSSAPRLPSAINARMAAGPSSHRAAAPGGRAPRVCIFLPTRAAAGARIYLPAEYPRVGGAIIAARPARRPKCARRRRRGGLEERAVQSHLHGIVRRHGIVPCRAAAAGQIDENARRHHRRRRARASTRPSGASSTIDIAQRPSAWRRGNIFLSIGIVKECYILKQATSHHHVVLHGRALLQATWEVAFAEDIRGSNSERKPYRRNGMACPGHSERAAHLFWRRHLSTVIVMVSRCVVSDGRARLSMLYAISMPSSVFLFAVMRRIGILYHHHMQKPCCSRETVRRRAIYRDIGRCQ